MTESAPISIPPAKGTHARFEPTDWSVVLAAAGSSTPESTAALEKLCASYWYPVYAFLRRRGHAPEDAKDLTQGLFIHLLNNGGLRGADPSRARFRSFLLACLINHVRNEHDRARAAMRGGAVVTLSIDALTAERRYQIEPRDVVDPAKLFERRWAYDLAGRVMAELRVEYKRAAKASLYERLHHYLSVEPPSGLYPQVARDLAMQEGALRVALHRLRRRFGELLRLEIAKTVSDPAEVDDEIRHLLAALGE